MSFTVLFILSENIEDSVYPITHAKIIPDSETYYILFHDDVNHNLKASVSPRNFHALSCFNLPNFEEVDKVQRCTIFVRIMSKEKSEFIYIYIYIYIYISSYSTSNFLFRFL